MLSFSLRARACLYRENESANSNLIEEIEQTNSSSLISVQLEFDQYQQLKQLGANRWLVELSYLDLPPSSSPSLGSPLPKFPSLSMSPTSRTAISRTAFTVCSTLTLHYSVLSLVLHYSRLQPASSSTTSLPYHPSTAIFLTELGKIAICLVLVAHTGELRDFVKERKRIEAIWRYREIEEEERSLLLREREREEEHRRRDGSTGAAVGITSEPQSNGGGAKLHHRKNSSTTLAPPKNHGLSINVDRARTFPPTPSLSVIPATPAPEPSPTRIPEVSLLFPHRPSREQDESKSTLEDMRDQDWWRVLRATVFGRNSLALGVISILFVLQGQMQYIAASNLSVPLFQLAYQLKVSVIKPDFSDSCFD